MISGSTLFWNLLTGRSKISDERGELSVVALFRLLWVIHRQLRNVGVTRQVVAVHVENTSPGAVLLIYLLLRQATFLVVTKPLKDKNGNVEYMPEGVAMGIMIIGGGKEDKRFNTIKIVQVSNPSFDPKKKMKPWPNGALIFQTSGSTGHPKMCVFATSLYPTIKNICRHFALKRERVVITSPIAHSYGLITAILPMLMSGNTVYLIRNANILKYLDAIRKAVPTVSFISPALCKGLYQLNGSDHKQKFIFIAGERLAPYIFEETEKRFGKLINVYGCTEIGMMAASEPEGTVKDRANGSIRAINGVNLRVGKESNGIHCQSAYGQDGLIMLRDGQYDYVLRDKESWMDTRDVASAPSPTVELFSVVGRSDFSYNRNGFLVNPELTEEKILSFNPRLKEVMIVAIPIAHKHFDQKVIAILVPSEEITSQDYSRMMTKIDVSLSQQEKPDEYRTADKLMYLPNGKRDRRAVLDQIKEDASYGVILNINELKS